MLNSPIVNKYVNTTPLIFVSYRTLHYLLKKEINQDPKFCAVSLLPFIYDYMLNQRLGLDEIALLNITFNFIDSHCDVVHSIALNSLVLVHDKDISIFFRFLRDL